MSKIGRFLILLLIFLVIGLVAASIVYAQPLGPHGELVDPCYLNRGAGCLHTGLFSCDQCSAFPNGCTDPSCSGSGPVDCFIGTDPSLYARWAWGTACKNCVPFDVRPIIANTIPPTNPTEADFERAGALIVTTGSWGINPSLTCNAWRNQLRVYYCTLWPHDGLCTKNGYTTATTPTRTPTHGGPTWTPTITSTPVTTAITPTTRTPTTTPSITAVSSCIDGQTKTVQGPFGPVLLVCVGGTWMQATPTSVAPTKVSAAASATRAPTTTATIAASASPTPTARTIVVPPRPTIGSVTATPSPAVLPSSGAVVPVVPSAPPVSRSTPVPSVVLTPLPSSSPTAPPGTGKGCLPAALLVVAGVVAAVRR
jgi:hypothetical protein